jgi:hypothetical protein
MSANVSASVSTAPVVFGGRSKRASTVDYRAFAELSRSRKEI